MTHNSSMNFKLIHFLLLLKGSHRSPNFETFECSGESLPNSSCHFANHKSVFLQILHLSSVPWKVTPLFFFRSNVIFFAQSNQSKSTFLRLSSAWVKIHQILVNLKQQISFSSNLASLFSVMRYNSSVLFKVQIWWNFVWAVESLKSCTMMDSFFPDHVIKFQLKKYRRVISHDTEGWCKF